MTVVDWIKWVGEKAIKSADIIPILSLNSFLPIKYVKKIEPTLNNTIVTLPMIKKIVGSVP